MELYTQQLIDDLRKARTVVRPPSDVWDDVDVNDEGLVEDMAYVEEFIYGTPQPMSKIIGIETKLLPPPHKLNDEQKATIVVEIEATLQHFNFVLEFPIDFPKHLRYKFLLEIWEDDFVAVSFGQSHIEFCDFEVESCPFPDHCKLCYEFEEECKEDPKSDCSDDEDTDLLLPF
jgi:hypothetical protein